MHVHCLHWLMSTGLLFQSIFCRSCKSATGEIVPMEGSNLAVGAWYVSTCLSKPCNDNIGPLWVYVDVLTTLNSANICVILLLCFILCHHPSHLCAPPSHPLYMLAQFSWIPWKNHQKLVKISIIYLPVQLYKS